MIMYGNDMFTNQDPRIEQRPYTFSEEKILDFSHTCLAVSPDHPHYGRKGDFDDYLHYQHNCTAPINNTPEQEVYSGATTKENLDQFFLRRLAYNPDFDNMMSRIDAFMKQHPQNG